MYNHTPDPSRARPADSWIEISSRPSNSSLSSAGEDAEQRQRPSTRRRRATNRPSRLPLNLADGPSRDIGNNGGSSSSQEEYEESESESDRLVTSSNEALAQHSASDDHAEEDDDEYDYDEYDNQDEIATAISGHTGPQCFTPQPNAFTHPPPTSSSSRNQSSAPGSYFPPVRPPPTSQRHSYPGNQHRDQRSVHSPRNAASPNHQAHHDEALRASLTTLLSCAAAARGLPKKQESSSTHATRGPPARVDTTTLRMVPEAVALRTEEGNSSNVPNQQSVPTAESTSASPSNRDSSLSPPAHKYHNALSQQHVQQQAQAQALDKAKRKAASGNNAGRSNSKDRRAVKKPRRLVSSAGSTNISEISPTLTTWVVSAGVLVLVSALSFSAGYAAGREAGRMETGSMSAVKDIGDNSSSCAREAGTGMGKGLKRLRWGSATASVRA